MSHPPIRFLDRAKETTTTTGSGSITLGGAVAGFVAISGIGNGNSTYYTITENNDFEIGIGTYNSAGNTLSRSEVFSSSNSDNSKINLGGGATVFITYSADKVVSRTSGNYVGIGVDPEYQLQVAGTGSFDTVRWADGTVQTTAATGGTSYTAGTGLNLVGTTFNVSGSTTSVQGIVQLEDGLSTSTTKAITPNAVNTTSGNLQSSIDTNTSNITTNATNITATGAINAADIIEVSGDVATNTSNISTNTSNISTNTSNISTNTSNISTNAANITETGAINAADIIEVSGDVATNASNISTNTSNISTNASNITATGAINAADIIEVSGEVATNTSNISTNTSNISTNTSNISTNTSNISTNASNITATGAINAADIIEVSGDVATNASNISTNTSNISTNASNITATGAINAADILVVSGIAVAHTTPGGSDTQVQFNDGGSFAGDSDFTWNKTSNTLTIAGYALPNTDASLSGYVLTSNADGTTKWAEASGGGGGGGGAPTSAEYVTLALSPGLSDERVLVVGTGLQLTDGGANSNVTVDASGATTSNIGVVQLQDSATDGTVDRAITPNAVYDVSGVLQGKVDTNTSNISTNTSNISTNATNITATGAINAADIIEVSGDVATNTSNISTNTSNISTNTSNISTNTSNISTNATNITATGAINAADIIEVSGDVATNTSNISTNTSNISTNTSNISTNAANITATGAINAADIIEVSGDVATNASNISTNTSNISTNTTNIAATGQRNHDDIIYVSGVTDTNAANISTNTSNISTNAANITATGAINAADIIEVSGDVATNTSNISTNTSNISTNTSNISTNTSNISTNAANITATGAINAADIIEVSGDVATNASNISTNTSNISTNTTNIAATGQRNHDDIIYVSGVTDTNASNISTNTSNISTNATNITATGAINAADILIVSGLTGSSAAGSDTYVQFNDGGSAFGGESNFTFTKAGSGILKVGTIITNAADAASYPENVSIGSGARASDTESVAVGSDADASGPYATAVGHGAEASTYGSVGIGQNSKADGTASVAVGHGANAGGNQSVALGYLNSAAGQRSIVIGDSSNDNSNSYGVAIGYTAKSNGSNSVAVGRSAQASAYSVALGYQATAPTSGLVIGAAADNSILSGQFNDTAAATNGYLLTSTKFGINRTSKPDAMLDVTSFANTDVGVIVQGAASQTADLQQWQNSAGTTLASIAPGLNTTDRMTLMVSGTIVSNPSDADRIGVVSIGSGAYTSADYGIAVGSTAKANNAKSVAMGQGANAGGGAHPSIAIGSAASATSYRSVAVGPSATCSADSATAIGSNAEAVGNATAVGYNAGANGSISTAIGYQADANGASSLAILYQATALGDNAIAIGHRAVAPTSGLVVGAGTNNHILSGQFNDTFDAVNGHLNILGDSLKISGNGQVRVNDAYTLPTAVAGGSDYVLTAQTDGSTAWAAAAGGSPGGSDTYVQFNDGGSSFGGERSFRFDKTGSGVLVLHGNVVAKNRDAGRIGVVAIGSGAQAQGSYGTSLGAGAIAEQQAVAIGGNALVNSVGAVGIGMSVFASSSAVAVGNSAYGNTGGTAIGYDAHANGTESTALGNVSEVTHYGIGVGYDATTSDVCGMALGYKAHAKGAYSIAIGKDVIAPTSGMVIGVAGDNSILSGQFNDTAAATNGYLLTSTKFGINRTSTPDAMLDVTSHANTDVGVIVQGAASQTADLTQWQNSAGTTLASIAPSLNTTDRMTLMVSGTIVSNPSDVDRIAVLSIGSGAYATNNYATAVGSKAIADATHGTTIGFQSKVLSDAGTAVGSNSEAGYCGVSVGQFATSSNTHSVAVGSNAEATALRAIAIGHSSIQSHQSSIGIGAYSESQGSYSIAIGRTAKAATFGIGLGINVIAPTSGLVVGAGTNNHILSGQFNDTFDAVNGHLNILGDSLKVSGNGQVRVNDAYTFPTAVAGGSDYVLTAQTDGSTAWAAAAGGSAAGSDTYVQFNDGGSSFGGESEFTYSKAGSGILKVGTIVTNDADAARPGSVVIGSGAVAGYDNSIVIGRGAKAGQVDSITIGYGAYGYDNWGDKNVSIGYGASAYSHGVAIGKSARTLGTNGVGIGTSSWGGYRGVAIGYQNGFWNTAGVKYGVAIGYGAQTVGSSNSHESMVTIGYAANVYGDYGVAIGRESKGSDYSVSLGYKAIAPDSGLVIGAGSDNAILSGQFNDTSAATNGYLLTSTKFGINRTSKPDAMLDVTSFANTDVGVIVQGAASQTADLQQWQNSAGTTVASISPNSDPNGGAVLLISGTIVSSPADIDQIGVVSIGSGCYVSGDYNVAIGSNNYLKQTYPGSSIENKYNILIGNDNYITEHEGPGNVYIGNGITGGTSPNASDYGVGIGWQNRVGTASVAIGKSANNQAGAINSVVAIGGTANCYNEGATAVGPDSRSRGLQSTVLGYKAGESTDLLGSAPTSNYSTALGSWAIAGSYGVSIGYKVVAPTSGFVVGGGFNNHILSGQFNDTFDAVNGHLNILGDSLKVSGNGQVRVNDAYTLPTAVAGGSDYVLTAQTDGSTAWAAAAGGSAAGSDTYVQFNDGGSAFGGESEFTYTKAGSGILKVGTIVTNDADAAFNGTVSIGSGARAGDGLGIAIGRNATAYANVVVGSEASASTDYRSIAVGTYATANVQGGTSIGREAECGGRNSVALGYYAKADEMNCIAIGAQAQTQVAQGIAIGKDSETNGSFAMAFGYGSYALGTSSIAIGGYAVAPTSGFVVGAGQAAGDNSILSGQFNDTAAATNGYLLTSTKFGINRTSKPDAMLDVTNFANTDVGVIVQGAASQTADLQQWQDSAGTTLASIAPGLNTTDRMTLMVSGTIVSNALDATRKSSVSIGSGSYTLNDSSVAIGALAKAGHVYEEGTALGSRAEAYGRSVAIGAQAKANTHYYTVAIGYFADAKNEKCVAIGYQARAEDATTTIGFGAAGENACVAIGEGAGATPGIASVAIGQEAHTVGGQAVSIGSNSDANTYGTAIGYFAEAPTSGLVLGAGRNNHILSGQFNDTFDAVNGHLNILGDSLKISGNGQVRVNDAYTLPTAVAGGSDYVLTAQTDGSTAWAAAAGGSAAGSDTYVQFNDGGSSFGGESRMTYDKTGSGTLMLNGRVIACPSDANLIQSMSIGSGAEALGSYSVAIGPLAQGDAGGSATAVGRQALAGTNSVALGNGADASAAGATALGKGTTAAGTAVAIGFNATATTTRSVAIGDDTNSTHSYSVGVGYQCDSDGDYSTAVGIAASAGSRSIGLGLHADASADYSIAMGNYQIAPQSGFVIGQGAGNSILSGQFNDTAAATNGYLLTSTKFGINRTSKPEAMLDVTNHANTDVGVIVQGAASQTADLQQWQNSAGTTLASIAPSLNTTDRMTMMVSGTIVSNPSDADRIGVVSIGSGAYSMTDNNVVIGTNATVGSPGAYGGAVSIGMNAHAMSWGIAIGQGASATSSQPHMPSIAIGYAATANGQRRALAIGSSASAGNRCISIGNDSDAGDSSHGSTVAIGYGCRSVTLSSIAVGTEVVNVGDYNTVLGHNFTVDSTVQSGLIIGRNANNHILSGQFNDRFDAVNGHLNILGDSLKVSGNGQVRVNDAYTLPTAVAGGSDYVLTAQTDGSTAWAAAAGGGGSAAGASNYIQYNNGGAFDADGNFTWNSGTQVLTVSGHIAATTKSFLIDHPTKPEKQLQYACLEGPENGVYVRGHTNDRIIDLPDYWTGLVDEDSITVQITAKDAPQPYLYVSGVANNQVHLISDRSVSAYYTINGTRKDVAPLQVEI